MVLAWGEFGRTPKMNDKRGRDHWPGVFSAALAGGGIQGGRAVGASDSKDAYPIADPKAPQDVEGRIRAAGGKLDTLLTIIREGAKSRVTLPIR